MTIILLRGIIKLEEESKNCIEDISSMQAQKGKVMQPKPLYA